MKLTDRDSGFKKTVQFLFSLWIVYHIAVIVVMPNSNSFLVRQVGDSLIPYANVLGLNTSWNFFSPDPAHVMYFEYSVTRKDQPVEEESPTYYIPPEKDHGPFGNAKRRIMYSMRYVVLDQRRVDAILGPWLCRKHPEAYQIHVEHKIETIPPIDEAVVKNNPEMDERTQLIKMVNKDFNCQDLDQVNL